MWIFEAAKEPLSHTQSTKAEEWAPIPFLAYLGGRETEKPFFIL
jgi:hypothetical protein